MGNINGTGASSEMIDSLSSDHYVENNVVRKGLLIGINYTGSDYELNGCINDSHNLKIFLLNNSYFVEDELIMMNDNCEDHLYPTKDHIMKQLHELVHFANDNPNKLVYLFLSYSGHGYYLQDKNGDEEDGQDEVLCPVDCDDGNYIVDDELMEKFVSKLPKNVKLMTLIDACHSGSVLDLRYNYDTNLICTENNKEHDTKCDVIMISGCRDNQTSSDAYLKNNSTGMYEYQGAMSSAFINKFRDEISYTELVTQMRDYLKKNNFEQVPQLSAGKRINLEDPILLSAFDE